MDRRDRPDRTEPALANEQTESTEANEPTESTEANEPTEPMDRMEPADPTDRIDPEEPIDKMDPLEPMLKIDPVEPASRREQFPLRMGSFSQPAPEPAATGHRTRVAVGAVIAWPRPRRRAGHIETSAAFQTPAPHHNDVLILLSYVLMAMAVI